MSKKIIYFYFFVLIILILIGNISYAQDPNFENLTFSKSELISSSFHYHKDSNYSWPLFGYYSISSYFGKRISPTTGASSYHSGIDIPAPTGTNIYSIDSGKVIFTGFYGADRIYHHHRKSQYPSALCTCFPQFYR